jgi:hypothetical protein
MSTRGMLAPVLAVSMMLVWVSPADGAEPALSWSAPKAIAPEMIIDIDCPSTGLCVAGDDHGNLMTTSNPSDPAASWSSAQVLGTSLNSVSCASSNLCVAVSDNGCPSNVVCSEVVEDAKLVTSTNPTGGAAAWTATTIPGVSFMGAVDCTVGLCAALDIEGRIITSTNPTGGSAAWSIADVQGSTNLFLSAIDCPTSSFCVAVGSQSHNLGGGFFVQENVVMTSTEPTGGVGAWQKSFIGFRSFIRAISCPTTTFCVGVDKLGETWTSTNPTGGTDAWNETFIDPNEELMDVSCPTTAFCAAVDQSGQVLTSTEPLGEMSSWGITPVGNLPSISCPSSTLCLAAGEREVAVGIPPLPAPPTGAGGSPSPPVSVPPVNPSSVFLPPKALKAKKGKVVKVPLSCLGLVSCTGTARLSALSRATGKPLTIGSAHFAIGPSRSKTVLVPLNSKGRAMFETKNWVRAQLRIFGRFGDGQPISLSRFVTLKK